MRTAFAVKIPQVLVDEAREAIVGTGLRAEQTGSVPGAVLACVETYLTYYPAVRHEPTTRGRTPEPAERLIYMSPDEDTEAQVAEFMVEWRDRLEHGWRNTPRTQRTSTRPPKPEYRGLVIAAIREATDTKFWGMAEGGQHA